MHIWTVQHYGFYEDLLNKGFAYTKGNSTTDENCPERYDWMVDQMNKRIGNPELKEIKKPIWGWYTYNQDAATLEEDIADSLEESFDYFGNKNVLIEAEIPREKLLVTDYGLWAGTSLRGCLLTPDNLMCEFFYNVLSACNKGEIPGFGEMDGFFKSYIYRSWEKLIYEDPDGIIDVNPNPSTVSKQVTFWLLKASDVFSVKLYQNDGEPNNESIYQGDFHYTKDLTEEFKEHTKHYKV